MTNVIKFQPRPDPKAEAEAERQRAVDALAEHILDIARRHASVVTAEDRAAALLAEAERIMRNLQTPPGHG